MTFNNEALPERYSAEQQAVINALLANLVATPWYGLLGRKGEPASPPIWRCRSRCYRSFGAVCRWLFVAIGYHAVFNMIAAIAA